MDEKLVTLSTMVDKQALQLRDNRLKLSKQLLKKIQERKAGRQPGAVPSGGRNKLEFKNGYWVYTGTHAWKMTPPADGESLIKEWKGENTIGVPTTKRGWRMAQQTAGLTLGF